MGYGLIGERLPYSFSPQIHAMLGDYEYRLIELAPDELEGFFSRGDFDGVNVTIPYKKAAMRFCAELTPAAEKIGCVNTVVRKKDGRLLGHNTDYDGFMWLLKSTGTDVRGKKALILGTGGAALTVRTVLTELGAGEIINISRSGENNYNNLDKHADAELLVNATPVGTYPNNGECLVELGRLPELSCVVDVVYNPAKTRLLSEAEKRKIPCANGLGMLVAQAKAASELFTGKTVSDTVIPAIVKAIEGQTKNILLVGMPGCGKSSVGKELSKLTGRPLTDTDELIVKRSGRTIREIFSTDGETVFRRLEHEALEECSKQSGTVISCGGGAVLREDNIDLMRQNSFVVWLRRDVALLSRAGRPLSANADLEGMFAARQPYYEAASEYVIDNIGTPEETAITILKELGL